MTDSDVRPAGVLRLVIGFLMTASACVPAVAAGNATTPDEYTVKSAYLYNFAKFVSWPDSSAAVGQGTPFTIGILGPDRFGKDFEVRLRDRAVYGRPIAVKRFASPTAIQACHILFVSGLDTKEQDALLRDLKERPILTVGDDESFAREGGVVGFYIESGAVRFAINSRAAERSGLKISSKLLSLARIIGEGGEEAPQ